MGLRLEVVSAQSKSLGDRATKKFGPDGGSIGRSLDSDWCLPDNRRVLSSTHACVDFQSGAYFIIDTSTNGVFVNAAGEAIGKGRRQQLQTGDRVKIGDYEMVATIDQVGSSFDELVKADHIDPVDVRQRVEAPEPTTSDLLDATEITGIGIQMVLDEDEADTLTPPDFAHDFGDEEELSLAARLVTDTIPATGSQADTDDADDEFEFELEPEPEPAPVAEAQPAPQAAAPAAQAGQPEATTFELTLAETTTQVAPEEAPPLQETGTQTAGPAFEPAPPAFVATDDSGISVSESEATDPGMSLAEMVAAESLRNPAAPIEASSAASLIAAFCQGAGLKPIPMDAEDARATMFRLGQAMLAMSGGLTNALRLRAVQKARLRQSQTMLQPRLNNPIKFATSAHEALVKLLSPASEKYLEPTEAIEDAFADLNTHQRILVSVLPKVLDNYIRQLDPDALEEKFSNGKRNLLMNAAQKLKYWDLYKDVYAVVVDQASDELPEVFLDALAEAYEREARGGSSAETTGTGDARKAESGTQKSEKPASEKRAAS